MSFFLLFFSLVRLVFNASTTESVNKEDNSGEFRRFFKSNIVLTFKFEKVFMSKFT